MKVPRSQRTETFDALRAAYEERVIAINTLYKAGFLDKESWFEDMQEQVKIMHVQAYAAGRSGEWEDITQSEWGRVGNRLRRQYEALRGFQGDLDNISLAQMNARANMYGAAARQQFESAIGEEKGLPGDALPAQPGDATTECWTMCKCRWAIRKRNTVHICTWKLGRAEHCKTCLLRARSWKNLRVKDGVMLSEVEPIFAR